MVHQGLRHREREARQRLVRLGRREGEGHARRNVLLSAREDDDRVRLNHVKLHCTGRKAARLANRQSHGRGGLRTGGRVRFRYAPPGLVQVKHRVRAPAVEGEEGLARARARRNIQVQAAL